MQTAFVRDGQRYHREVDRDDGAVIRFRGPGRTHPPHDLVHYVVEYDELAAAWKRVPDGERLVPDRPPARRRRGERARRRKAARVR